MRILGILGILLAIVGATWILQGINVLPGSVMTGQIQWAIYGGIAVAVGIGLFCMPGARNRRTLTGQWEIILIILL